METSQNKKIIIVTSIGLNELGGPVTIVNWLADNFKAQNINFLVVELFHQKKFYKCKLVNILIKGWMFLKSLIKLNKNVNQGDIIFVNDALGAGVPGLIVSVFKRNKFIVRLGGEPVWERYLQKNTDSQVDLNKFFEAGMHKRMSWMFWLVKKVLSRADKIIVPSDLLKTILINKYKIENKNIRVINNPIVNQVIKPQVKNELKKSFLFVGRLINLKNIIFLTDCFVKANLENWRLIIVGTGENEKQLKILAEKNIGKIVLAGQLPKSEIIKLFSEVDCLLLPSFTDVFPNVVMEAISHGLPTAVTNNTGLPHTIKDNLFVFSDVTNSDRMITDLKKLATLEVINKLNDNLLKIDWEEFKSEKVFNQYLSVFYE